MADALFSVVAKMNGVRPWGSFLDAGTGVHSLKFVMTIQTSSWTAITADIQMKNSIENDNSIILRPSDRLMVGNWMNEEFCNSIGKFDTILADYLIGAVDGFSPYEQDTVLKKLKASLNPGGRLYVIGMNPLPDHTPPPSDIVGEVRRVRDSCILLAGHRPYREFPLSWMKRHLEHCDLKIINSKNFTILHSEDSVRRQLRVAQSKLPYIKSVTLRNGMEVFLNELDARIQNTFQTQVPTGRIPLSFDYVVEAENASESGRVSMDNEQLFETLESVEESDLRKATSEVNTETTTSKTEI